MTWKYTDSLENTVFRILAGGAVESRSVDDPAIQEWLQNHTPEAADAPPAEQQNAELIAQIEAVEKLQARAIREITLGIDTNNVALGLLQQHEQQIAALRAQLQE